MCVCICILSIQYFIVPQKGCWFQKKKRSKIIGERRGATTLEEIPMSPFASFSLITELVEELCDKWDESINIVLQFPIYPGFDIGIGEFRGYCGHLNAEVVQLLWALIWVTRFRFGPLEGSV